MKDLIDRQAAIRRYCGSADGSSFSNRTKSQYEELTPEEAASEIASGSTMSAWYWFNVMTRIEQMVYVICRKR